MDDIRRPLHADGEIPERDGWTDSDWLLLVEDDGPNGLGRVVGYFVFRTQKDAERCNRLGALMDALGMYIGEEIPENVYQTEIMTYADFVASYGNRMPLNNRG